MYRRRTAHYPEAKDSSGRTIPARNAAVRSDRGDDVGGGGGLLQATNASSAAGAEEWEYTRCWNESASVFVTIIDLCPCQYSWGRQEVCCGPIPHFDLSFWAHQKLAHPLQVLY
jgi:hypothetical protein